MLGYHKKVSNAANFLYFSLWHLGHQFKVNDNINEHTDFALRGNAKTCIKKKFACK